MKTKGLILSSLFVLLCLVCACSDDSDDNGGGGNVYSNAVGVRPIKADINGTSYIGIGAIDADNQIHATRSDDGSSDVEGLQNVLYKMDEDGNMSAVVYYIELIVDEQTGDSTTRDASTLLDIVPQYIEDFGGAYIKLHFEYRFRESGEGQYDGMSESLRQMIQQPHVYLIRVSDGAMFDYDALGPITHSEGQFVALNDDNETVFFNDYGVISKVSSQGRELTYETVTPSGISYIGFAVNDDEHVFASLSGNFTSAYNTVVGEGLFYLSSRTGTAQLPEEVKGFSNYSTLVIDGDFYLLAFSGRTIYLYRLDLGSTTGSNHATMQYVASCEMDADYYYLYVAKNYSMGEDKAKLMIGYQNQLIVDLSANTIEFESLGEFADMEYDKNGLYYQFDTSAKTITVYNVIEMTKKTVNYDTSALPDYYSRGSYFDSNRLKLIEYGISYSSGQQLIIEIDAVTGEVSYTQTPDNRTITTLIQIN